MAGFVDLNYQDPLANIGGTLRQLDADSAAGNSLAAGDYAGARNSLFSAGFPAQAQTVQQIQDSNDNNNRQNAAAKRTQDAADLSKTIGAQYAGGDTEGAKKAAIAAGNLDLAKSYEDYEASSEKGAREAALRDAMSKAAGLTAAGDVNGARKLLLPFYSSPQDLLNEARTSQQDIAKKSGEFALSYEGNPQGWVTEGAPALRRMGIDPSNYEDEAGRKALIAGAGLSKDVFNAANKGGGAGGTALAKNANFIKAAFSQDPANADVTIPAAELQKVAANPRGWELQTQVGPDGTKQAVAVQITNPKQGAYGLATELQGQNQAWNSEHAEEIKAGTMQPKETDLSALYDHAAGRDSQRLNAQARAAIADPENRGNIALQTTLKKQDAQSMLRESSAVQSMNHMKQLDDLLGQPGADDALAPIQKLGGWQQFSNLANSGRVQIPAALGNMRQAAAVIGRELANAAHVPGSGPESDVRNQEMRESFERLIMDSPNAAVAKERLAGMRAVAQGYVNAPLSSELYNNKAFQGARQAEAARATEALQAPQTGGKTYLPGQTPPAPQGALMGVVDKNGNKLWYNPATGERTPRQ